MKKLIILLLLVICGSVAEAQTFHVGVEGGFCTRTGSFKDFNKIQSYNVNASYTQNLPWGLTLTPQLAVFYEYIDKPEPAMDGLPLLDDTYTWGTRFAFFAGKSLFKPIYVFTGPMAAINFHRDRRMADLHRSYMQWRFGLGANVWRLRITAQYDVYVTDRYVTYGKENGILSFSLAFGF